MNGNTTKLWADGGGVKYVIFKNILYSNYIGLGKYILGLKVSAGLQKLSAAMLPRCQTFAIGPSPLGNFPIIEAFKHIFNFSPFFTRFTRPIFRNQLSSFLVWSEQTYRVPMEQQPQVVPICSLWDPGHIHWARGAYDTSKWHIRRGWSPELLLKIFWTNKNSHFWPKHEVFVPKFGFLMSIYFL